jgi:hypothetical protein
MKLVFPLLLIALASTLAAFGLVGVIWGPYDVLLSGLALMAGVVMMIWAQIWLRESFSGASI